MKLKFIALIALIALITVILSGCNYDMIDTTYSYDRAIIKLPNGEVVEGKVEKWKDYEGETLQVQVGGKIYLTNTFNCALIVD